MLSIVIPTYNEVNNLEPLIEQISQALRGTSDYELIFVDDSDDDTPQKLQELSEQNPKVHFKHREKTRGLASAVVQGFSMTKGDVIAVMDADLQHPPELLATMYQEIEGGADIVLPSRYINEGKDEGLSWFRKLASLTAMYVGKILLSSLHQVSDPTSGYFMMRREVIAGKNLRPTGWKILVEVLSLGNYEKVVEIPYEFQKRYADESKMSLKVTIEYFLHIFSLIIRSERDRRFFQFLLVGLSGVVVDMLVFAVTSQVWSLHVNVCATVSAGVAMINNYVLNRNFTWRLEKHSGGKNILLEFLRFILVCSIGIIIKNLVVFAMVLLGLVGWAANLMGIVVAGLFNFFFSSKWVFTGGVLVSKRFSNEPGGAGRLDR